jgi:hypothetical protein
VHRLSPSSVLPFRAAVPSWVTANASSLHTRCSSGT